MNKILLISSSYGKNKNYQILHGEQKIENNYELKKVFINEENFPLRQKALQECLQAKMFKMLAYEFFRDFDYYIWLDANIVLNNSDSIMWLIKKCENYDFAFFKHYVRNNIIDEANFILNEIKKNNKYLIERCSNELIKDQIEFYKSDSRFKNNKLFACGCFIYSKTALNKNVNLLQQWFYQCCRFSIRDQLSLPYLLDINPEFSFNTIEENLIKNKYLSYKQH